jgi:hypothetical protein
MGKKDSYEISIRPKMARLRSGSFVLAKGLDWLRMMYIRGAAKASEALTIAVSEK